MKTIWGSCEAVGEDTWELAAPKDTPDGIGSALAVWGEVPLVGSPVTIEWKLLERWGGEEEWRGFWLMFPNEILVWPAPYIIPKSNGWQRGYSNGPNPEDEIVAETIRYHGCVDFFGTRRRSLALSADGNALHIGVGGIVTMSIARSQFWPGMTWPPLLGLYCEASRVRVKVTKLEEG